MTQVWSCGGGTQSGAIAELIRLGKLPRPDFAFMTDTGRERFSTWPFVDGFIRPERLFGLLAFVEDLAAPMPFPEPMPDIATRDELSFATAMEYLAKGRGVKRKYWPQTKTLHINMASLSVHVAPTVLNQRSEPYAVLREDIIACDWELLP